MDEAPIEPSDYHDLARVSAPAVSPDGGTVAFLRQIPDDGDSYERTVYAVPADGSDDPRRFTASEGEDAEPTWSPSGDRLAFVSDRGTEGAPQLRIVPAAGGESERVTDVPGGVSDVAWAPDGSAIAFTQEITAGEREAGHDRAAPDEYEREEPDPRVIDRTVYRAFQSYFDGARSHVYVVDLDGTSAAGGEDAPPGAAVTRVTEGEYDFVSPAWGDEDTLYCAVKRGTEDDHGDPDDDDTYDIEAYDLGAEDPSPETVTRTTTWLPQLAATADGRVAYTWTPEDRMSMRQTEIEVYDRGADETTRLTDGLDRTVAAVLVDAGIAWGPDDEYVYFVTPDEGRFPLRRADAEGVAVAVEGATLSGFDVAGGTVAVTQSTSEHPGNVYAGPLGDAGDSVPADLTRLSAVNADYLDAHRVDAPEELRFESDGHEIQGWVLTPPGFDDGDADGDADGEEEHSLVVEIHGGPHAMWTTAGSMWQEYRALAAAGYVVFWCNPRGSTGYGEAFATAIERDWGAVTATDVLAGADLVADRDGVDAHGQFVTGGSFGGFMTAWLVGHTDRFAGAVTQRGVYDLASFYGSTDAAYKLVEGDYDTVPAAEPAFLFEQSPVAAAGDVETPTLIMHAEADYRVPICNGEYLFRLLRKDGVDTRLVRYPREGHELSRAGEPDHVVDRLERIVRWFDGYSPHHDAARALDRDPDDGLSGGIDEADDEDEAETGG